jgi:hypothetical protein
LQVAQDGNGSLPLPGKVPNASNYYGLVVMAAVGKIQTKDVNSRFHQGMEFLLGCAGRTYRCNYLGSSEHFVTPSFSGSPPDIAPAVSLRFGRVKKVPAGFR